MATNFLFPFIRCEFLQIHHKVTFCYYIIHTYKISRRLKINNYNINQIYKFQNFIGLNYA